MKDHRYCFGRLMVLLLAIGIGSVVTPVSAQAEDSIQDENGLQFTAHQDGTFDVKANAIPLDKILSKISDQSNIDIYVDDESRKSPVTISVSNISLIQLLKRIAGDNYVINYDKNNITAFHILPKGNDNGEKNDVVVSEFSGQVRVSNQRARMFFMPQSSEKSAVSSYIQKRHEILAMLAKTNPDKELQSQISFQGYLSSEQIVSLVKGNHLDPVTLNIGWKENGGGYDLKKDESIEDAIKSAEFHHKQFVSQLREDADMQVATLRQSGISDAQMQPAITFQENAHELESVSQSKGIPFYGVRVAASASQLNKLTSEEKMIRLVDPIWGGAVENEIANTYPTKKIVIPLVPDAENFIP